LKIPLFRVYPIIYAIPFLLSAMRLETWLPLVETMRWLVLGYGVLFFFDPRLRHSFRKPRTFVWADVILMLILCAFFASAAWSINPSYTVQRAVSFTLLILISFWMFWRYVDVYSEVYLLRLLLSVVAVTMFLSLSLEPINLSQSSRFRGLFNNPNNIGIIAALSVPLGFSFWLRQRSYFHLLLFTLPLLTLLLAGTRSALLGIGFSIGVILISFLGRSPQKGSLAILLLLLLSVAFVQTDFFVDRVLRESTLGTASTRTFFWELSERYIAS
jgi:hypothetical protein